MVIQLPKPDEDNLFSLEKAFRLRETKREYSESAITLHHLSKLLHAAQGKRTDSNKLLTPSAQEQYPLTIHVVIKNVLDVSEGLYQYDNMNHSLALIEAGQFSESLEKTAIGEQAWVSNAVVVFVLSSDIQSMNKHFAAQKPLNQRGERYCYIEVGAVAQNVQLQATALNIGMVLVGGFDNDQVKSVLQISDELEPSAFLCLGNV